MGGETLRTRLYGKTGCFFNKTVLQKYVDARLNYLKAMTGYRGQIDRTTISRAVSHTISWSAFIGDRLTYGEKHTKPRHKKQGAAESALPILQSPSGGKFALATLLLVCRLPAFPGHPDSTGVAEGG